MVLAILVWYSHLSHVSYPVQSPGYASSRDQSSRLTLWGGQPLGSRELRWASGVLLLGAQLLLVLVSMCP